ncbi:S-adenosyl-L-methionine-dependent methyltransferase [Hypoxylon rubiginosum]|uniref:S-adenosyl-L-methionine-dependent methyltransferase n=1 Tax=Hypoxylon rubiginosum TaxID=110542 RepID=A0ACC0CJ46_9PEZI|nr:S-adenosyl-L-methionine-dependent methyltransferase [Hypoxylon rubiginosum]
MTDISQFDSLAQLYADWSEMPFRQHLEFPSVLGFVGQVDGQRILDLGCGSGVFSRQLAKRGAATVVGFDQSSGMLDFAVQQEAKEPLGIRYIPGTLPTELHGSFDLVLAVYVLPYARSYNELLSLCRSAADALRPGQRLLASPMSPAINTDPSYYSRYGFRITPSGPLTDSTPVDLNLRFDHYDAHVTAYYWTAATLEKALVEAGFTSITWHPYQVAETDDVDPAFIEPYLYCPHAAIIEATKTPVRCDG